VDELLEAVPEVALRAAVEVVVERVGAMLDRPFDHPPSCEASGVGSRR